MLNVFCFIFFASAVFAAEDTSFNSTEFISKITDTNETTKKMLIKFNNNVFTQINTLFIKENEKEILTLFLLVCRKAVNEIGYCKENSIDLQVTDDVKHFYVQFIHVLITKFFEYYNDEKHNEFKKYIKKQNIHFKKLIENEHERFLLLCEALLIKYDFHITSEIQKQNKFRFVELAMIYHTEKEVKINANTVTLKENDSNEKIQFEGEDVVDKPTTSTDDAGSSIFSDRIPLKSKINEKLVEITSGSITSDEYIDSDSDTIINEEDCVSLSEDGTERNTKSDDSFDSSLFTDDHNDNIILKSITLFLLFTYTIWSFYVIYAILHPML